MENSAIQNLQGTEVTFVIPDTESLGALKDLTPKFSLSLKYKNSDDWAISKDKPLRCYFMGMKQIPNEHGEIINCGVFVTEKECFIAGQMTLLDAVKNLLPKTPIEITYTGKKANKSSDGQTMIFDIQKLG